MELYKSLLRFQDDLKTLNKSATNPFFHSEYVPLEEVIKTAQPILSKHGLGVTQFPDNIDGKPALTSILFHANSGETQKATMALELTKQDPQAQGSAITYARRYAYMSILGLVGDKDDDGNAASSPVSTGSQVADYPATEKTKKFLFGLFTQKHPGKDVTEWIAEQYGYIAKDMTQEQASTIIDDLKVS